MDSRTKRVSCCRIALVVLSFALVAGPALAECAEGTYFIDLKTGQTFPSPAPAHITLLSLGPTANPSCDTGWQSAVLRLNLAPPCSEAEITVEFDKPIAWTVHIADSPTSDGYGGDGGTTLNNAEMWINQQS